MEVIKYSLECREHFHMEPKIFNTLEECYDWMIENSDDLDECHNGVEIKFWTFDDSVYTLTEHGNSDGYSYLSVTAKKNHDSVTIKIILPDDDEMKRLKAKVKVREYQETINKLTDKLQSGYYNKQIDDLNNQIKALCTKYEL